MKFGDYYPKYNAQSSYKQKLQYEITQYQSIDNDENIAHDFWNPAINIHNESMPELESFPTKLK